MKMIEQEQKDLAGSFTLLGKSMILNRMGYGAMQLAGRDGSKLVWGPPRNVDSIGKPEKEF